MRPQGRGGKARALALRIAKLSLELRPKLDELKQLEREFDALLADAPPPVIKAPKVKALAKIPVGERVLAFYAEHPGEHRTAEVCKAVDAPLSSISGALVALAGSGHLVQIRKGVYANAVMDIGPKRLKGNGHVCNGDE